MNNLRKRVTQCLTTSMESQPPLPRTENRKGWLIYRFDTLEDDLSLITQDRIDEWSKLNQLLLVIEKAEEMKLSDDAYHEFNRIKPALTDAGIPWFTNEDDLDEFIRVEHRPEGGEA